jgi:hypothetical protein
VVEDDGVGAAGTFRRRYGTVIMFDGGGGFYWYDKGRNTKQDFVHPEAPATWLGIITR